MLLRAGTKAVHNRGVMKEKVVLKSVGCRTNQEEMEALGNRLLNDGYFLVDKEKDADIIILNTCSVTGHTESKTKRLINSFSRKNPKAKIMLTGCLAQQSPHELMESSNVGWVVGNTRKSEIPKILENCNEGLFYSIFDESEAEVADFFDENSNPATSGRTRYSLKIQEGCDFSCSYCIVPALRGPSRAVKKEKVLNDCKRAVESGFKEIVITGTHIGQYSDGDDYNFVSILKDILSVPGFFRIRLSSLDPREFSGELLEFIISEDRICDHLHISMQSLSSTVLERMHRTYTGFDQFKKRVKQFKNCRPKAALGGDFIVGFPGETEEEFTKTLKEVSSIGFNYGHVFRYSIRPGTAAEEMGDQISDIVKKERSEKLRELLEKAHDKFLKSQVGSVTNIISEKEEPLSGLTSNYVRVVLEGVKGSKNIWVNTRITEADRVRNCCMGKILKRDNLD